MLKPYQTACLIVDCQSAFFDAQGTLRTRMVAERIERDVPLLRQKGVALYSVFSKADSLEVAGLSDNVRQYAHAVRKQHESAFRGTGLGNLIKNAHRKNIILMGFHTTTCMRLSAGDAISAGFNVYIAPTHVGEGQRGRSLPSQEIAHREESTLLQLQKKGAKVVPLSNLFPSMK
ncbi:MAG: isochorismatase family protein [Pseudomonadota bacterium]